MRTHQLLHIMCPGFHLHWLLHRRRCSPFTVNGTVGSAASCFDAIVYIIPGEAEAELLRHD